MTQQALCQMNVPGVCLVQANGKHHRKRRSEGDHRDVNLMEACAGCHDWTHGHPEHSRSLGWIVPTWADPEEIPVLAWSPVDQQGREWLSAVGAVPGGLSASTSPGGHSADCVGDKSYPAEHGSEPSPSGAEVSGFNSRRDSPFRDNVPCEPDETDPSDNGGSSSGSQETCPKCQGSGRVTPQPAKKMEPKKKRVVLGIRCPKEVGEDGIEVLETLLSAARDELREEMGWSKTVSPYFIITAVFADWLSSR